MPCFFALCPQHTAALHDYLCTSLAAAQRCLACHSDPPQEVFEGPFVVAQADPSRMAEKVEKACVRNVHKNGQSLAVVEKAAVESSGLDFAFAGPACPAAALEKLARSAVAEKLGCPAGAERLVGPVEAGWPAQAVVLA